MRNGTRQRIVGFLFGAVALMACLPAAAITFDFEDGTLQGWQTSTTGGSGSTGVEVHGPSKAAFVKHQGAGSHTLSYDFLYTATDRLSFDMHAVALLSARGDNAVAGVTLSFLNAFNVSQGSMSLFNATYALSGTQLPVDNLPHSYAGTIASFAAQAGISPGAAIAKFTMSFTAAANTSFFGDVSTATVWADNVSLIPVPEPSQAALWLAGLALGAGVAWRRGWSSRPA